MVHGGCVTSADVAAWPHGCQFISSLVRALAKLPGGMGGFLPCGVGSHMSWLRHLGWNQCSHGLTFKLLESCHHRCLTAACGFLGYPKGSASELLDGTLKPQHCTTIFTLRCLPLVFTLGWEWRQTKEVCYSSSFEFRE